MFETLVDCVGYQVIPTGNHWSWSSRVEKARVWGQISALLAAEFALGDFYKPVENMICATVYKKIC